MKFVLSTFIFCVLIFVAACSLTAVAQPRLGHPYDEAATVRIVSFRTKSPAGDPVFSLGSLNVPSRAVIDNLTLTTPQRDSLFRLLTTDLCRQDGTGICYDPRHAIVFFNLQGQPFAYIELCFSCTNYETSADIALDFCYEKSEAIRGMFQRFGVRYFGYGESE